MKGIRFLAAIAACLMVAVAMADDTDEAKKKINSIKKNSSYLYAEVTAATADEARSLAEEILYAEINEWAAGQKKLRNSPGLTVNNKQALWTTMSLPRGNMFRSFIYVKKSDILPVANSEVIANPAAAEAGRAAGSEAQPELVSTVAPVVPEAVAELMRFADYKPMAERIMRMKAEAQGGKLRLLRPAAQPRGLLSRHIQPRGQARGLPLAGQGARQPRHGQARQGGQLQRAWRGRIYC